jgi:hypothetical protein
MKAKVSRVLKEWGARGPGSTKPTAYDPALCDAVVNFAETTGMSITAFAGSMRVSRWTVMQWAKQYPEFAEAIAAANAARTLFIEKRVPMEQMPAQVSYHLKALQKAAAEDWAEKTTVVHEGGEKPVQMVQMTPAEAYAQMVRETGGA